MYDIWVVSLSLKGRRELKALPFTEPPHEAWGAGRRERGGGKSSSVWFLEEMDVGSLAFLSLYCSHCTDTPLLNMWVRSCRRFFWSIPLVLNVIYFESHGAPVSNLPLLLHSSALLSVLSRRQRGVPKPELLLGAGWLHLPSVPPAGSGFEPLCKWNGDPVCHCLPSEWHFRVLLDLPAPGQKLILLLLLWLWYPSLQQVTASFYVAHSKHSRSPPPPLSLLSYL